MKKFYSTLAIVIVIAGHFVARIIMQDAYTFSASDYRNLIEIESPSSNIPSNTLLTNYNISASSITHSNSFNILPVDAFAAQWNP